MLTPHRVSVTTDNRRALSVNRTSIFSFTAFSTSCRSTETRHVGVIHQPLVTVSQRKIHRRCFGHRNISVVFTSRHNRKQSLKTALLLFTQVRLLLSFSVLKCVFDCCTLTHRIESFYSEGVVTRKQSSDLTVVLLGWAALKPLADGTVCCHIF